MNKERSDRTIAPLFLYWYIGYGSGVKQCLLKCVIGGRTTPIQFICACYRSLLLLCNSYVLFRGLSNDQVEQFR